MNLLDLGLLAFILVGLGFGIARGFVSELFDTFGFLIAIAVSFILFLPLSSLVLCFFKVSQLTANVIAFFVIYITVGTGLFYLARIFHKIADIPILKSINWISGGLFGALKMVSIIWVCLVMAGNLPMKEPLKNVFKQSQVVAVVQTANIPAVILINNTLIPQSIRQKLANFILSSDFQRK